jgi:hypothetical protein
MSTRWSPLTEARPPARRRPTTRLPLREAMPTWLVLAALSWLVLIITILYLWSFA